LSKPSASRGWVCAFCTVPVLAIVAIALLTSSPASRRTTASAKGPHSTQPVTPAARGRVQANFAALPLAFDENKGQTDAQVEYMARGNGYTLFLTANDAVFSLRSSSAASRTSTIRRCTELQAKNLPKPRDIHKDSTAVVRMQLAGANSLAKVSGSGQLPGTSNYFIGNDPSKWQKDVAHFARVSYQDVYPGINLAFHGAQRQVEFDFVVAAAANPAPIGFHFTGAQHIKTDDSGNLVVSSAAGDVLLHKPVAYQEQNGQRQPVNAQFVLKANNQVSFDIGNYDHNRALIIDPSVSYEYSTYLGGSSDDEGQGIAVDSTGAAYITGETASTNFPGASNSLIGTAGNAFVTKISPDGSGLDYSTYIGGHGTNGDSGNAIAVNQISGIAYVSGGTTSSDFPVTAGAFQTTLKGATNAFVCELGPTGARTYCTYLGGSGTDTALGIALASDSSGDVYVVGKTSSTNFPATASPLQGSLGSGNTSAGFVTKLNSTGTAPLLFSTYLGGSSSGDLAGAVAVDSSNNNVYVTGQTFSATFPTTSGAYQTTCGSCTGGNSNAFVTGINPTGSAYIYSTFLGGNSLDTGDGIAVDSTGSAYVTGSTNSTKFPTSSGAFQTTYGGGNDAFVTKLKADGSALVYSTFLGGSGFDAGASIGLDSSNNAYITGQTNSSPFPTVGATQSSLGGGFDAFVSEINSSGTQLVFSTYLGGTQDEDDGGNYGAIAVNSTGANIYVTGNTVSTNFPTQSPYPYSGGNANGGGNDAFAVKYTQPITASFTLAATTPAAVSPGSSATSTVTLTANNGYSSAVNMSCSVSGSGSPLPACSASSFSTNPVTPTSSGATSTLTITTTGATGAMFVPRNIFYAMGLPILGLSLIGVSFGSAPSQRKKLLGFLTIATVVGALFLMPACGGGSSGSGGGGGGCTGCTAAGSYTVTITGTGTDTNTTTQSTQVTLKVN
jgi:hypothetical protein